jgi:hypothetical protein
MSGSHQVPLSGQSKVFMGWKKENEAFPGIEIPVLLLKFKHENSL